MEIKEKLNQINMYNNKLNNVINNIDIKYKELEGTKNFLKQELNINEIYIQKIIKH